MSAVLCLPACLCVSAAASRGQAPNRNASMGLRFGGYMLEVCVVPAEVGDLEGWQVRCALV